jgi:hypothetical protein
MLLAALTCQSEEERAFQKLSGFLAEHLPELEEAARADAARRFALSIRAAHAWGHDPERLLRSVEFKLRIGVTHIRSMRSLAKVLGSGLDPWVPDAALRMKFPEELLKLAADAQVKAVDAYLSETVARPPSTEEEKAAIRAQLAILRETVVEALRTRIAGPYRDGVIAQMVDAVVTDQAGDDLGDPVAGAVTRPLSAAELEALKASIRLEAARAPAVEAASPADQAFAETGQEIAETPALNLASALANRIFAFGDYNYPRTSRAYDERDEAVDRATRWVHEAYEPIKKELERQGASFQAPVLPDPPRRKPAPAVAVPSAPEPGRPAPPREEPSRSSSTRGWAYGAAALVLAVLICRFIRR